jgi:hypothetical protein
MTADFKILTPTKPHQKLRIYEIACLMSKSGLSSGFIVPAVELACIYEGVYDMMELWEREPDEIERDLLVMDIQCLLKVK